MTRISGPYRGVSDVLAHIDQPGDTAPPEAWLNARINSVGSEKATFGRRPALVPAFTQTVGDGTRVQGMGVISTARGSSYTTGATTTVDEITSLSGASTTGQAWLLDNLLQPIAVFRDPYPDLDGDGTPASDNRNGWRCSWHPSNPNKGVFATLQTKDYGGSIGTRTITHLTYFDMSEDPDDRKVWTKEVEDKTTAGTLAADPRDLRAARVVCTENFVLVAVGPYIQVYRASDGVYIQRLTLPTWAYHLVDLGYTPRVSRRLYALAWGNPDLSGEVTDDTFNEGADFRACVVYLWLDDKATSAVNDSIVGAIDSLTRKPPSYAYYENHGTLRFSEWLPHSPRGFLPFSMTFGEVLSLYTTNGRDVRSPVLLFAGANQAFGPDNSTHAPDGSVPYFSVFEATTSGNEYLKGNGVDQWPVTIGPIGDPQVFRTFGDTDTIKDDWESTGWFNDRPVDADLEPITTTTSGDVGPYPSICAIDSVKRDSLQTSFTNRVFTFGAGKVIGVAGPPDTRANVFGWDINGGLVWRAFVGGDVFPHCVRYDAYRNVVVVAGQRNSDWTGASGRMASLWRLDPESGAIIDFWDSGDDAWVYGLDVRFGRTLVVTDHVPV